MKNQYTVPRKLISTETGEANNYMMLHPERWVASVYINGEILPDQQKEIVQLMAAAPEMAEALTECIELIKRMQDFIHKIEPTQPSSKWLHLFSPSFTKGLDVLNKINKP